MLRTISCNPLGQLEHHIHLQASIKRATLSRIPTILCSANKYSKLHFVLSSGLLQSKIDTNGMCVDVGRTHQDAIIYYRHSMCSHRRMLRGYTRTSVNTINCLRISINRMSSALRMHFNITNNLRKLQIENTHIVPRQRIAFACDGTPSNCH